MQTSKRKKTFLKEMQMRLRYHRHLQTAALHLKSVAAARPAVQQAAAPVRVISCKTQCNGPVASCDLNMAFEEQRFTALSTYLSKKVYVALQELLVDKLRQAEEHFFVEPEDLDAQSKTRQDFLVASAIEEITFYNAATNFAHQDGKVVKTYVRCNPNYQNNGPWYDAAIVSLVTECFVGQDRS